MQRPHLEAGCLMFALCFLLCPRFPRSRHCSCHDDHASRHYDKLEQELSPLSFSGVPLAPGLGSEFESGI